MLMTRRSGDQHTPWANPFEERRLHISEWTAKEIATISSKLDKQLGPEYISSRAGPGGTRVHYLTAEKCIGLANEVFGFNGWSSSIQNIQVDFAEENPQTQRFSLGLSVIVRVTLRDGTYHEDVGYGSIENAKGKAMAFEKAKKEGTTDGLKRALRSFGNVLGNCIYDQDFVKQVTKVKAQPIKKFAEDNLHRHADFVKKHLAKAEPAAGAAAVVPKAEPAESFDDFLGEFDEADFCMPGEGHPDEVVLPNPAQAQAQEKTSTRQLSRVSSSEVHGRPPQKPSSANISPTGNYETSHNRRVPAARGREPPSTTMQHLQRPAPAPHPTEPVAFFSAKSVPQNPEETAARQHGHSNGAPPRQLFNPKAESPSIRKTPGIDHSSSRPLARDGQHVAPTSSQSAEPGANASAFTPLRQSVAGARGNVVNPSLDQARRIGAPGGPGSPLVNRGSYKPPSMKRPLQGDGSAARGPLVDVAANTLGQGSTAAAAADGVDAKRQKMV